MAKHHQTGQLGELLALEYFKEKGFEILFRNWRHKHWEVDLIMSRNGMLHFVEVKTRTNLKFGHPEESVDIKKIRYLINASEEFLFQYPQWQRIQFDILAITLQPDGQAVYFYIEDIYI